MNDGEKSPMDGDADLFDLPEGEEVVPDEQTISTIQTIASRLQGEENEAVEAQAPPIRCKSDTDPNKLGFFIIRRLEETDHVEIQTIGPQALSKACLAFIQAQKILVQYTSGAVIVNRFNVRKLQMRNDEERTAILMRVWAIPTKYAL